MATLHDLKEPIVQRLKGLHINPKEYNCQDLVDELDNCNDPDKINLYTAILMYKSWQSLVNIYYKNSSVVLNEEECYDIYLEAFYYIIDTKPWKNKDNSLYQDDDAFIKAMMTCTMSRKGNYVIYQHRKKRVLNSTALSLNDLNEDYQDGFFSHTYDKYDYGTADKIKYIIQNLFLIKDYLTAFILDIILYKDTIYDTDLNNLDMYQLRHSLKTMPEQECLFFARQYDLDTEEVLHSTTYFKNLNAKQLEKKINVSIDKLKLILINSNIFTEEEIKDDTTI